MADINAAPQAEAVQAQALEVLDRDWLSPLDENCYQNKCITCGNLYLGYKRSFQCKACAGTLASASDAAQTEDRKLLEQAEQALWTLREHNHLHFGHNHSTVAVAQKAWWAIRVRLYGKQGK